MIYYTLLKIIYLLILFIIFHWYCNIDIDINNHKNFLMYKNLIK